MAVFIIAQVDIHDRAEYDQYQDGFLDIFARFAGELLVVSDHPRVLEGEWSHTRLVLLRFPSEEEARRWYESPEYQALAQHRYRGATATVILAKGLR